MSHRQALTLTVLVASALVCLAAIEPPDPAHEPALGEESPPPAPAEEGEPPSVPKPAKSEAPPAVEGMIERGAYLVKLGGCNDCHTPPKMGTNGREPDAERMLSGHPEGLEMPPPPPLPDGPWSWVGAATNTAFAGPWGVSYGTNLTPDRDTGIGTWTEQTFIETMRSGRHGGDGRSILPPMPWQNVAILTDDDLRSMFRYLTSLPPIRNRVPEAIVAEPPAGAGAPGGGTASRRGEAGGGSAR